MTLGMSHPIGPLHLADLIGLDVCVAIMQVLERDLGQAKYAPAKNLQELVRAGRLGRKSGEGVFSYATEAAVKS
jgi:3-hydroxybutyryl-CoA dehydrogenase